MIGAAAVLLVPAKLLFSAVLAAAVHESFHLIALALCGVKIHGLRIGTGRAVIETAPLPANLELLCTAAGPAGSFLCFALARHFPLLGLCGFIQGMYNLLPIYPMDGGRILLCLLTLTVPSKAQEISKHITFIFFFALVGCSFFLYLRTSRLLFLLIGGYFLHSTTACRKTPCQKGQYWVQ